MSQYIDSIQDLEEIINIFSKQGEPKPYYTTYKCIDRGFITIKLIEENFCNNPKCENCTSFRNLLKK